MQITNIVLEAKKKQANIAWFTSTRNKMNNIVRLNIHNFYKQQSDSAASLPETPPPPDPENNQRSIHQKKRLGRQGSKSKTYKKKKKNSLKVSVVQGFLFQRHKFGKSF